MEEDLEFEDPTRIRQISDGKSKRSFDQLVEAWDDQQTAEEELRSFKRDYILPEPPMDVTESLESFIEYDRQKRRYEERLESINAKLEERNAAFQAKASVVGLLLPEGHTLRHGYQGDRPELQGKFYAISHKPAQRRNQLPRITVKPTKRPHTPSL